MAINQKIDEIKRLIDAFSIESDKFHPLNFSLDYVTQEGPSSVRKFADPNHAILLWQYYGGVNFDSDSNNFAENIATSEIDFGLRGAQLSCFAVIEGVGCELFIRMAQRAGSIFDSNEVRSLRIKMLNEVMEKDRARDDFSKPVSVSNDNPVAIWLNYLLYHLSLINPGRERARKIQPDPFTLSLMALERLMLDLSPGKVDRSTGDVRSLKFRVAMSFPGEKRAFVSQVVEALRPELPPDSIFYDFDYQAQLARPNLDSLLVDIYRNRSDLVVVYLSEEYAQKEWCGLEWRSIRDLIKAKKDDQLMYFRFDDASIDGVLSIDGYVDARKQTPIEVAGMIIQRLSFIP